MRRCWLRGLADLAFKVLQRQGPTKQVALEAFAAMRQQKLVVFSGFHPFGDHIQPQAAGQGND